MKKNKLNEKLFKIPIPYISPVILVLLIFLIAPLILIVIVSFLEPNNIGLWSNRFTFNNYILFFKNAYLIRILIRTITISLTVMSIDLVLGYIVAYYISFSESKIASIIPAFLIAPLFVAGVIRAYGWILFLSANGPINIIFQSIGIIDKPIRFLWNQSAVIVGMSEYFLPFMIFPIFGTLLNIDTSLLEAAENLGASATHRFLKITLPLSSGGVVAGCVLVFCGAFASFVYPQLLGGGRVMVLGNTIYQYFWQTMNWPLGSVIGLIALLVSLFLISIYLKLGKKYEIS